MSELTEKMEQLKALAELIHPLPWKTGDGSPENHHEGPDVIISGEYPENPIIFKANANFSNYDINSSYAVLAANIAPDLVAEIERLRAALKWYANSDNYDDDHAPVIKSRIFGMVTYDEGEKARASLRGEK